MKAFYSGPEFRAAVEEVLGKINNALGLKPISITWTQEVPTAAINKTGKVLLADIQDDARVPHSVLVRYVGMGAHELCHHAYTDWITVHQPKGALLTQLHNAVEDAYIERRAIRAGLTGNIASLFETLIGGMVAEALSDVTDWADPRQYPFALAVYLRDHATVKVPLAQGLEPIFAEAARQFKSCANSDDALAIAVWVEAQLRALPSQKPENKQEQQDKGQEQGQDKGQPGDGQDKAGQEPGQEGTQNGAGDANDGEGTPTPQPGPATAPTGLEEFRPVEPVVESPDGTDGLSGSYNESATLGPKGAHLGSVTYNLDSIRVAAGLRYNLKRLFDNSARTEFGLRRATGAVDVNSLSRVGVTDKVFKRRSEIEGIDSAVVILLDVSGSMRRRMLPAVECCAALLDALDRAQVATSVLTFGSNTSELKGFGDRKQAAIKSLARVSPFGGTNDFFAVRYAHKLLMQRREVRKVCLVLTDGCGNQDATRRQVEAGKNLGITTIGIGIQFDVSGVYSQNIEVDNLGDLFEASFKQIKLAA
jgi:cobalamin biosynthesis protein CobT